jgi:hypothetical protein
MVSLDTFDLVKSVHSSQNRLDDKLPGNKDCNTCACILEGMWHTHDIKQSAGITAIGNGRSLQC